MDPRQEAIMTRTLALNGLAYRDFRCKACNYHLADEGILLGCLRKRCPRCKVPNEIEVNRVGEEQLMEYVATRRSMQEQTEQQDQEDRESHGK